MRENRILKMLCSIPFIVVIGYYIPFIAVCLIITRYFVYSNRKYYETSLYLFVVGLLILIPQLVVKIGMISIPYLDSIVDSSVYPSITKYSEFLIGCSIVFLILSMVLKKMLDKCSSFIRSYINRHEQMQIEVSKENDMKMKIKQEKSRNTQVVYCEHCGADNVLSETVGVCKYCRRSLNNKRNKEV